MQREYKSLYRTNEATGHTIIDISLDEYYEFFHEWDNSVFRKRDIHPELAEFLDLCSEDIPLRKDLEIALSLTRLRLTTKEKLKYEQATLTTITL